MKYILGIDQGGTKTHVIIADVDGNILGMGHTAGAQSMDDVRENQMQLIQAACKEALLQAQIPKAEFTCVSAGLTGADFPYEYTLYQKRLFEIYHPEHVLVKNDCIIAMKAGTPKPFGAVACVGTGFNCGVCSPDGDEFTFGYYISDRFQGGSGIGEEAFRAVIEAHVGVAPETHLTERVLAHFHLESVDDLLFKKVHRSITHHQITKLAKVIVDCAEEDGDVIAISILENYGYHVFRFLSAGLRRYDFCSRMVDIVLSGNVFKSRKQIIADKIQKELQYFPVRTNLIHARYEPVVGAVLLWLCRQSPSGVLSPRQMDNIDTTAARFGLIRRNDSDYFI